MAGIFSKFKKGLAKTREGFVERLSTMVKGRTLDEEFFEELEDTLIQADIGVETSINLVESIREQARKRSVRNGEEVFPILQEGITNILGGSEGALSFAPEGPTVILVVGVNGVGKTTSIGKLAYKLKNENKKVLLAAADTFRAAASEQLETWAQRAGVQIIKHQEGADPAAVVFDSLQAAVSRNIDVVMIDTAGRLQNKKNLMEEVKKIRRVAEREIEGAPHEVLLVVDASTGQNAISQAESFNELLDLTGIILAKLDGTAKGGIVVSIAEKLNIPVKYVGLGEKIDDLEEFNPEEFAKALFAVQEGEANES
jgi:fused signal recognition particle receptor